MKYNTNKLTLLLLYIISPYVIYYIIRNCIVDNLTDL